MATINPIDDLYQSVQKVGDDGLKTELLGKLTEVQNDLSARQGQIEALRTQLDNGSVRNSPSPIIYDPPV